MKLRSGHLDDNAIRLLLTGYLGEKLEFLEATLMHRVVSVDDCPTDTGRRRLRAVNKSAPLREQIARNYFGGTDELGVKAAEREEQLRTKIKKGDYSNAEEAILLAKQFGFRLHVDDQQSLQVRLLGLDVRLAAVEKAARLDSDFLEFEKLKKYLLEEKAAIKPRFYLGDAVEVYKKQYDDPKCTVKVNSIRAAKRELDFILMTFGENAELNEINNKASVDKLKTALAKKTKSNGDPLSAKSVSEYLKRFSSLVKAIIDKNEVDVVNKITGTHDAGGAVKDRDSFDSNDIKRLENALCTAPMLFGRKPRPRNDRFWIILAALLQGFRKSALVDLKELNFYIDPATKLECFDLRPGADPTGKTRVAAPIHPLLIKVGFLKWLEKTKTGNPGRKLFEDNPLSFGQWWNGTSEANSWNRINVTQNPKITFHSLRHYFCAWADELDIDDKIKNEMSGHADRHVGKNVRQRHYLERTRAKRMRDVQNMSIEGGRILLSDIDWDRLQRRAEELFDLN